MKFLGLFLVICGISLPCFGDFKSDTAPYYLVRGHIVGMKMLATPPANGGLYNLGVQKNDIVISYNYQRIHSAQEAATAYQKRSLAAVSVIRSGKNLLLRKKT
jgi:hypothetical protein